MGGVFYTPYAFYLYSVNDYPYSVNDYLYSVNDYPYSVNDYKYCGVPKNAKNAHFQGAFGHKKDRNPYISRDFGCIT